MKELLNKISNELERKGIEQKSLAKKMEVTPSSVTYYLKGTVNMKFYPFYILISNTFENRNAIIDGLKEFTRRTSKQLDIMECLEWALQNNEYELFEFALQKADKVTAEIYNLHVLRRRRQIQPDQLIKEIEKIKNKKVKKELDLLLQIISLYVFFDMKKYGMITIYTEIILDRLSLLKEGYLKEAYRMRIHEVAAVSYLKENQVGRATEIAQSIVTDNKLNESFPLLANSMINLLGEAHIFTDYNKAIQYSKESIKMFKELRFGDNAVREQGLKSTYDFINITANRYEGLYLEDKAEQAHFLAKQGKEEKKTALHILEIMERNYRLTPHQLYYRALATGKKLDFRIALKEFYRSGDYFYCQLIEKREEFKIID